MTGCRYRESVITLRFIPAVAYVLLCVCLRFMFNDPIAYFLTFTVRGSWRHGDPRGSWKRNARFIARGTKVDSKPCKNPPHFFVEAECLVIGQAFDELCAEREWVLHEKSVLSNHVHIVLTAHDVLPGRVMQLLKSKATLRLRRGDFVEHDEKNMDAARQHKILVR